jgi:hypothetical protein
MRAFTKENLLLWAQAQCDAHNKSKGVNMWAGVRDILLDIVIKHTRFSLSDQSRDDIIDDYVDLLLQGVTEPYSEMTVERLLQYFCGDEFGAFEIESMEGFIETMNLIGVHDYEIHYTK